MTSSTTDELQPCHASRPPGRLGPRIIVFLDRTVVCCSNAGQSNEFPSGAGLGEATPKPEPQREARNLRLKSAIRHRESQIPRPSSIPDCHSFAFDSRVSRPCSLQLVRFSGFPVSQLSACPPASCPTARLCNRAVWPVSLSAGSAEDRGCQDLLLGNWPGP